MAKPHLGLVSSIDTLKWNAMKMLMFPIVNDRNNPLGLGLGMQFFLELKIYF